MLKFTKTSFLLFLAVAMFVTAVPALANDTISSLQEPVPEEPIPVDRDGSDQVPLMPKDPAKTPNPTQITPNPNGCVVSADEDPRRVGLFEVEGTGRVECNVDTHVYLKVCLQKKGWLGIWSTVGCDHNDAIDDLLYVAHTESCSSSGLQDWRVKNYAEAYISGTTYSGTAYSEAATLYCQTP